MGRGGQEGNGERPPGGGRGRWGNGNGIGVARNGRRVGVSTPNTATAIACPMFMDSSSHSPPRDSLTIGTYFAGLGHITPSHLSAAPCTAFPNILATPPPPITSMYRYMRVCRCPCKRSGFSRTATCLC